MNLRDRMLIVKIMVAAVVSLGSLQACFGAESAQSRPIILINTDLEKADAKSLSVPYAYARAVIKAGGIPLLMPPQDGEAIDAMLDRVDGLLLIGGADYPPEVYKQEAHQKTVLMHKDRSDFDLALAKKALGRKDLPVLGICAGCQVLNIADGGDLVQDIPSAFAESRVSHSSKSGWQSGSGTHGVKLDAGSKLAQIYKKQDHEVRSSHHQCVGCVGDDFRVVAKADDGVSEAIEGKDPERFLMGVQWHPEKDLDNNIALFEKLVESARMRQQQRSLR
jgi:putative glutamine amidotransferase